MNLLPKAKAEFSETAYWENFFKKRGSKSFDWYGEFPELCTLLNKYVKPKDDILVVGCGNSTLSSSMYDVGYRNITNIDTSSVVIRQMKDTNAKTRPGLIFEQKDAMDTGYADNQFSVVLDKGTLDALMPDGEESTVEQVNRLFQEINRVLRVGGRYICVSLLQPHILQHLLQKFPVPAPEGFGWPLRICLCQEAIAANLQTNTGGPTMPVFFIVCTKFKAIPGMKSITEMSLSEQHVSRVEREEISEQVLSLQQASLVTWKLRTKKQTPGSADEDGGLNIQLHQPGEENPRYTLKVIDRASTGKGSAHKFVAFVVPQGRENEYLFSAPEGQKQLISMTGADRVALVCLHRGQKYESMDSIKEELASSIVQLAPQSLPPDAQIPFLSTGDDMGHREVIYEGHSNFSGDFVVEDVQCDGGEKFRKLVFLSNQAVVQSEALLKNSRNNKNTFVDITHLACEHHRLMSLALALEPQPEVLVIGLGGGGLCSFLCKCFSNCRVTAVDIDESMLMVAEKYFGMSQSEKLKVVIDDGLKFIKNAAESGTKFSTVLFDVDNKDTSLGMSCPPKEFVSDEVLNNVKSILKDQGVFILNLVCRDPSLKKKTMEDLRRMFKSLVSVPLQEEVNEVVYCSSTKTPEELKKWVQESAKKANVCAKKASVKDELLDLKDLLQNLMIL